MKPSGNGNHPQRDNEDVRLHLSEAEMTSVEHEASKRGYTDVSEYLLDLHRQSVKGQVDTYEEAENQAPRVSYDSLPQSVFETDHGKIFRGDSSELMRSVLEPESVDLIMTSPPFGLIRKKDYGNEDADQYLSWFRRFAEGFARVLKPNGSLVIDIGGSWKKGLPTRSLYHFELLTMLCREFGFHLAQEFYWWNPSKLPTPAEWVTVRRIRVKDAVNCVWWLSPTPYPKVSNERVLQPYSDSMKHLLKSGYKPKLRPSGHDISDKFQKDNGGAIPPNLLALANTESNGAYQRYCREHGIKEHPARFPIGIPAFFARMLTEKDDIVFDPFAGSCVTGEASERLGREWICCETDQEYVEGAKGRFRGIGNTLFPNETEVGRTQPYEIFPPNSLPIDEQNTPLVEDGGREHSKSKKANDSEDINAGR